MGMRASGRRLRRAVLRCPLPLLPCSTTVVGMEVGMLSWSRSEDRNFSSWRFINVSSLAAVT